MENSPAVVVSTDRFSFVSGFTAVTMAPGKRAPLESRTTPTREAVGAWLKRLTPIKTNRYSNRVDEDTCLNVGNLVMKSARTWKNDQSARRFAMSGSRSSEESPLKPACSPLRSLRDRKFGRTVLSRLYDDPTSCPGGRQARIRVAAATINPHELNEISTNRGARSHILNSP